MRIKVNVLPRCGLDNGFRRFGSLEVTTKISPLRSFLKARAPFLISHFPVVIIVFLDDQGPVDDLGIVPQLQGREIGSNAGPQAPLELLAL